MMSKMWLIAVHEYKRHVLNKGFLFAVLSVPVLIALMVGLGILTDRMRSSSKAIGYVDHSARLVNPPPYSGPSPEGFLAERPVPLITYATEELARSALDAGEIQAYYVLAADYFTTKHTELVYNSPPSNNATAQFHDFLQANWLADLSPEIARRAIEGDSLIVRTPDGVREQRENSPISMLLPLFIAMAFIILFMSTSMTLMQAMVEEKENRTIEVIATSVPPSQLVGGKVLGISAMGLTEIVAWLALSALAVFVGGKVLGLQWMQGIRVHPRILLTIVAVAIPSYVLFAALMLAIGASVADAQESQQIGGLFSLFFTMPFYGLIALVEHPGSALAIGLSLFPLTALTSFCILAAFSSVPLWQVVAGMLITSGWAVGAIWLAGRAFRLGMLRYGQRVNWRELIPSRYSSGWPVWRRVGKNE
jgi:ABC-2 type transport system permease protein